MMKPFRNLKGLKLEGGSVIYENVEELVGELSALGVKIRHMADEDWFGERLKKIAETKRADHNLKMFFDLTFKTSNFVDLLERLCKEIYAVKTLRGLAICLTLYNDHDVSPLPVERLKEVLSRYVEIRNWKVFLWNGHTSLGYIKVDGEKVQFYVH